MPTYFPVRSNTRETVTGSPIVLVEIGKAADAAASTTTAEYAIGAVPHNCILDAAPFISPSAAVTANATNNATITLGYRRDGGSRVTIATLVTDVAGGDWVAWTNKAMSAVAGLLLNKNDVITLQVAKGGTGVQLPALVLNVPIKGRR
jgi:hypothetical protein